MAWFSLLPAIIWAGGGAELVAAAIGKAPGGAAPATECTAVQLARNPGLSNESVQVGGQQRRYVLYAPPTKEAEAPLPLWILAPGAFNEPEKQMEMSEMVLYADQLRFAFVALRGSQNLMNVVRHARPAPDRPDDVAYTDAVVQQVEKLLCIDRRRIFCTGYSRGARFCMLLASERSQLIAAAAVVGGVRFPIPNNATRAVPIMGFHGTADPINPWKGDGNPEYWYESVPAAVSKWAHFNGCRQSNDNITNQLLDAPNVLVAVEQHTQCKDGAKVELYIVKGGGHTWPGSRYKWADSLGLCTQAVNANEIMGKFFSEHPMPALSQQAASRHAALVRRSKGPSSSSSSSSSTTTSTISVNIRGTSTSTVTESGINGRSSSNSSNWNNSSGGGSRSSLDSSVQEK